MKLVHIIPALKDNYIFVIEDSELNQAIVVDPAEAHKTIEFLESRSLDLVGILVTHHHPDHTAGVKDLISKYKVPVFLSQICQLNFTNKHYVTNLQTINISSFRVLVVASPGHTLDHVIYYFQDLNSAFVGDCIFNLGCGRLYEGSPEIMWQSIEKIKSKLLPDTLLYCAHEYTLKNLEFCELYFSSHSLLEFGKQMKDLRTQDLPTIPMSLKSQIDLNPFLKCQSPSDFAKIRELRNLF